MIFPTLHQSREPDRAGRGEPCRGAPGLFLAEPLAAAWPGRPIGPGRGQWQTGSATGRPPAVEQKENKYRDNLHGRNVNSRGWRPGPRTPRSVPAKK